MSSFNMNGNFSKGFATFNEKKKFIYSDNKLLSRIKNNESDITDIYSELRTVYRNLNTLYGITNTHTSQISNLFSTTSGLRSDLTISDNNISSLQKYTNSLSSNLASTNNSLSSLSNSVSSLASSTQSSISSLQSSISSINSSINSLWGAVNSVSTSSYSLNSYSLKNTSYKTARMSTMALRSAPSILSESEPLEKLPEINNEPIEINTTEEPTVDILKTEMINITNRSNELLEEIKSSRNKINEIVTKSNDCEDSINENKNNLLETTLKLENLVNTVNENTNKISDILIQIEMVKNDVLSVKGELYEYINSLIFNTEDPGGEDMDETIQKLNEILTNLSNISISISHISTNLNTTKDTLDNMNAKLTNTATTFNNSLTRIEDKIDDLLGTKVVIPSINISANEQIINVDSGKDAVIYAKINGLTTGTCNVYVNNIFYKTLNNVIDNIEYELYREYANDSKDVTIYVEYPDGNKSNELTFSIVVNNKEAEEIFTISSSYTDMNVYTSGKVNYSLDIHGLKTKSFKVYINGSYFKTVTDVKTTENVIVYSEIITQDRLLYIQLEDENNDFTNILAYTVTVIDSAYDPEELTNPYVKTLIINCDDLERHINPGEEVECRASIRGLDYDSCNVYINDYYNNTVENISDYNDVLLYKFIPEEDIEVNIQIEGADNIKSNLLRYCIHINNADDEPVEEEIEVLPGPASECIQYSKLIGGNRSTWAAGNNELLSDMSKLNINCLTLSVRMVIEDYDSNTVSIDETDLNLCKELLLQMKSQNLLNKIQIILEPCPCINNGEVNERFFNPSDPELFLKNWRNEVVKLVNEFSDYSFYGIYVNTNMDNLADYIYLWQDIYDDLKYTRLDTNIMIKTNWWIGNEDDEETGLQGFTTKCTHEYFKIWDIISISAYFPLGSRQGEGTPSATYDEICRLIKMGSIEYDQKIENDIRTFAEVTEKPIMFGELGFPALLYGISFPESVNHTDVEDQITQRNWYQAWNDVFINYDWFLGWSFYHMADLYNSPYDPSERSAGLYIASINAINKYKI